MLNSRLKIPVFARVSGFTFVFDNLHAEIYHPEGCFRKNKPNSPIVQINLSYLSTTNYPIFTSLTKVKNKPNQTQYKPNSNPIQTQFKPNSNPIQTQFPKGQN